MSADQQPIVLWPMRRRHLRAVLAIEEATSPQPWSLGLFLGELKMPTSRLYYVAILGGEVVGYIGSLWNGPEAHITTVTVNETYRRRGIARLMMLQLITQLVERGVEDVTLEVRASNVGAQRLYHKFGFAPEGIRPGYYPEVPGKASKEDAVIMWARGIDREEFQQRMKQILLDGSTTSQ